MNTGVARHGAFVLLRRLRAPMAVLVIVYAFSVLGFTLIEGRTPSGQPWRMSFLHAFYFVSFLGTTIGLGEIPYPFSDAQRLWATASIYTTVLAWLYAIGAFFSVLQDPLLRRNRHESHVDRLVRGMGEPFYLLCGYDDSGYRVARELTENGSRVVVIDIDPERVDAVDFDEHPVHVPALAGDASDPRALTIAGLRDPNCAGVVALTGSDATNAKVALTARLLNPGLPVHCVAHDHAWHPRIAVAGATRIVNPFDAFAERVAMAVRTPSMHVLYEALTTQAGTAAAKAPSIPRGRWVLCGWNSFTRALRRQLEALSADVTVIDGNADADEQARSFIREDPTDPAVLRRAEVAEADALVAATGVDIDNLAIVLAARSLGKRLFIVARQTQRRNSTVFQNAPADMVLLSSAAIAGEVLRDMRAPLLSEFLRKAAGQDESWSSALLESMRETIGTDIVESWVMEVGHAQLPSVARALASGQGVHLKELLARMDGSPRLLRAIPLLLQRGQDRTLLPSPDESLRPGDRILFCGNSRARSRMRGLWPSPSIPRVQRPAGS